ncbi:MAG TPA: TdeIII family type II restriction endonuclease [Candidatus Cloacimonadota bacterium]|nr:TdeIII family type II restriction endonuclease [Candidatus Cloacimonadota bacterium]
MNIEQQKRIMDILKLSLLNKLKNYKPETTPMPFHTRLLGKDRMVLFSFIQSLNTTFGTSFYEPLSKEIASHRFNNPQIHYKVGDTISEGSSFVIQKIMDQLTTGQYKPNKIKEIEEIRKVCQQGEARKVKPTLADVSFTDNDGILYLYDIKTVKPNKGSFIEFKRTLLTWVAASLFNNPILKIQSFIAIPYNPYEPKPYERWTMAGMLDLKYDLKVAEEYWDFLGGKGTYEILLDCFEKVGIELKDALDNYFQRFNGK